MLKDAPDFPDLVQPTRANMVGGIRPPPSRADSWDIDPRIDKSGVWCSVRRQVHCFLWADSPQCMRCGCLTNRSSHADSGHSDQQLSFDDIGTEEDGQDEGELLFLVKYRFLKQSTFDVK